MNFFAGKKVYGGKWSEKTSYNLSKEDQDMITKAQVVDSEYGHSCCFFLKNGSCVYTPMSTDAVHNKIGDLLDVSTLEVVVLEKAGEADIERIRG